MDFELSGGSIVVSYEIFHINATYEEDRENVLGVCRMTGVEIECDGDVPSHILSEAERQIHNHFADQEYFTEDSNWNQQAKDDISDYTGVSSVNIDFE